MVLLNTGKKADELVVRDNDPKAQLERINVRVNFNVSDIEGGGGEINEGVRMQKNMGKG